jgi:hypothetical protein
MKKLEAMWRQDPRTEPDAFLDWSLPFLQRAGSNQAPTQELNWSNKALLLFKSGSQHWPKSTYAEILVLLRVL